MNLPKASKIGFASFDDAVNLFNIHDLLAHESQHRYLSLKGFHALLSHQVDTVCTWRLLFSKLYVA